MDYRLNLDLLKDNLNYIIVARVLNSLGIGLVPFEFTFPVKKFPVNQKGFADNKTYNILYINTEIPEQFVQRTTLHVLFYVIKNMNPGVYHFLSEQLKLDQEYTAFCQGPINRKILDGTYSFHEREDESLANFFTLNPDNERVPFGFFYQLNFPDSKVELPTKPFNQQKYLDMLLDMIKMF